MTIKIFWYKNNSPVDSVEIKDCIVIPRVGETVSLPHYFEAPRQILATVFRITQYKGWIDVDVK